MSNSIKVEKSFWVVTCPGSEGYFADRKDAYLFLANFISKDITEPENLAYYKSFYSKEGYDKYLHCVDVILDSLQKNKFNKAIDLYKKNFELLVLKKVSRVRSNNKKLYLKTIAKYRAEKLLNE